MISAEIFKRIAEKFKTPAYVYEQRKFGDQLLTLVNAISWRPLTILYAVKANFNFHVLRTMLTQPLPSGVSFGVDAISTGEEALALRAGVPKSLILHTGNNTTNEEVNTTVKRGILPNIDSLQRLDWVCWNYPGLPVCNRVMNPNAGAGHHDHCITASPTSKFGIWDVEAQKAVRIAKRRGSPIIGAHQHIGSQILDPEKFLYAMDVMHEIAMVYKDLQFIDYGGGFGIPYKPKEKPLDMSYLGPAMTGKHARFCKRYGRKLAMVLEPGRFLTAEAGFLLVRVNTVKVNPNGNIFVGVDSGFNHLIRPMAYGSYHEIVNISNPRGRLVKVYIVGNICEGGDKFTPEPRLINFPRVGDLLIIEDAGAYGYSMSSNYNLRPRPPEILVTPKGGIHEIRKRESEEELVARA